MKATKRFQIVADSKALAANVHTRRGEYTLGKMLLAEPMKQVSFGLTEKSNMLTIDANEFIGHSSLPPTKSDYFVM